MLNVHVNYSYYCISFQEFLYNYEIFLCRSAWIQVIKVAWVWCRQRLKGKRIEAMLLWWSQLKFRQLNF